MQPLIFVLLRKTAATLSSPLSSVISWAKQPGGISSFVVWNLSCFTKYSPLVELLEHWLGFISPIFCCALICRVIIRRKYKKQVTWKSTFLMVLSTVSFQWQSIWIVSIQHQNFHWWISVFFARRFLISFKPKLTFWNLFFLWQNSDASHSQKNLSELSKWNHSIDAHCSKKLLQQD